MLTYDRKLEPVQDELPTRGPLPDIIECGENNAVWFQVARKTRQLRIVSKTDGKVKKVHIEADIGEPAFAAVAACHGLGPRQIGAAWAALVAK